MSVLSEADVNREIVCISGACIGERGLLWGVDDTRNKVAIRNRLGGVWEDDQKHWVLDAPKATDREVAMLSPVLSAMREAKRDAIPPGKIGDCPAEREDEWGPMFCTRDKGHPGPHVAHGTRDEALERWPQ